MKEIIKHLENMAETLDGVTEENWADSPADIAAIYRSVANEIKSKMGISLENTQANPPLGEFFTDPKIGNFSQEIAIKYGLHISKHKGLYELPRGVMLHRFKGDKIVKLIGQYHNEEDHQKPKRVYTVEVSKGDGTHLVYIQEDDKCLMSITYNGSICDAEYVGIKALKAVLRSRDKRNQRCHNQDKKRKAAKAQEETI